LPRFPIYMITKSANVTDRQTDGRSTCGRKTALCTKVHCAVKTVAPVLLDWLRTSDGIKKSKKSKKV